MTAKLVALWTKPDDAEGFDMDYDATHVEIVRKMPGLVGAAFSSALLDGPYYRMAELRWPDAGAMQAALGSPEGAELLADAGRLQQAFGNKFDVLMLEEKTTI